MSSLWSTVARNPLVRAIAILLAASGVIKLTEHWLQRTNRQPRSWVAVLAIALSNARRTQTTRMAAALAYRTIFGVIPVLVVGLAVVGGFATDDDIKLMVTRIMSYAGLNTITVPSETGGALVDVPVESIADESPAQPVPEGVDDWITRLITNYRKIPFNTIGVVGLIALVYAAISMLVEIEQAFNHVCRAPSGRSWARRLTQYWAMLTLGPIFLIASFYTQDRLQTLVTELTSSGALSGFQQFLLSALSYMAPVVISTLLLLIVFTSMPNVKMRLVPSLMGAFLSALLWEAGKRAFTEYIAFSTSYVTIYGSIALIPLFMLWVYFTWVIVLLGLQMAQAVQVYMTARNGGMSVNVLATHVLAIDAPSAPKIVDPAIIIPVAAVVARGFDEGKVADRGSAAQEVGVDERITADMLDRLANAGFVHRIAQEEGEEGYCLSRPPESIRASDLLTAGIELAGVEGGKGGLSRSAAATLNSIESPRVDALRNKTLRDYLNAGATNGTGGAETPARTDSAATLGTKT